MRNQTETKKFIDLLREGVTENKINYIYPGSGSPITFSGSVAIKIQASDNVVIRAEKTLHIDGIYNTLVSAIRCREVNDRETILSSVNSLLETTLNKVL